MIAPWLLVTLLAPAAHADEAGYGTCCREAGVEPCPATMRLVGAESQVHGEVVTGLWTLGCDGTVSYERLDRAVVPLAEPGAVVGVLEPGAYACFVAACPLPPTICVDVRPDGRALATRCGDGLPPTAVDLYAPRAPRTAVVVGPREVVAAVRSDQPDLRAPREVAPPPSSAQDPWQTAPKTPAPPRAAPPPAAPQVPAQRAPDPPLAPASPPTPASPAPRAEPPPPRRAPAPDVPGGVAAFLLPPAPPSPCRPRPSARQASNDQVDRGDEARVARSVSQALDHYRAALVVEPCNAFAWAAVGGVLLDASDPGRAATALEHATRIDPGRVLPWIDLGRAREARGDVRGAVAAYTRAVELSPGEPRATAGLQRLVPTR